VSAVIMSELLASWLGHAQIAPVPAPAVSSPVDECNATGDTNAGSAPTEYLKIIDISRADGTVEYVPVEEDMDISTEGALLPDKPASTVPSLALEDGSSNSGGSESSVSTNRTAGTVRVEVVRVGLMRGLSSDVDPEGCGVQLTPAGVVRTLDKAGIAARWGEFKKGDKLKSVSGKPFTEGSQLADYLEDGKFAYLCTVERPIKVSQGKALSHRALRLIGQTGSAASRFQTEEAVAEALSNAGDFLKGGRR